MFLEAYKSGMQPKKFKTTRGSFPNNVRTRLFYPTVQMVWISKLLEQSPEVNITDQPIAPGKLF
jgi:hypothetical protein